MAAVALEPNQFVFAGSDAELEQQLGEAIEASIDDFAFRIQLEEVLHLSHYTFAYDLQLADITFQGESSSSASFPLSSPVQEASSSSSDSSSFEEDGFFVPFKRLSLNHNPEEQVYSSRRISKGKQVDSELQSRERSYQITKSLQVELCGICFDDAEQEMHEGLHCLHRYCHSCITRYVNSRVAQKRHQIYCPHDSCGEALTQQECAYFLPAEIYDAWSALELEAQISESEKVYCPFSDCSALLLKEENEDLLNAECPFCNRMFCLKCMVPWHAELECSEFQKLPPAERTQEDLQLLKLAEDRKWQRCGKCKGMIELAYGCIHITCRCGYQFCYECGVGWANGRSNCKCPLFNENHLLQRTN
ncbi:E3 ubiquitin-protein ligase RSL1 [Cryptomeria japonica]|uniref:E3 ubiquitin-protein ligase RSL1 n=1 Tax=Cryptomeria japonica TaxID=3369 RepID=UPI0027D9DB0C|nr:E3 ubiquitin-protein ligase RSL1 [Cryptomeria japonica]